jgi:hypothetical protein
LFYEINEGGILELKVSKNPRLYMDLEWLQTFQGSLELPMKMEEVNKNFFRLGKIILR